MTCPGAEWHPAQGWGGRCTIHGRAVIKNISGRDLWYLGYGQSEPVLYVTALREDGWEPLPSNVDPHRIDCRWYRLSADEETSGRLEAFANPEPIRIRVLVSFDPPVGDHVEAFEVLGPRTDLRETAGG